MRADGPVLRSYSLGGKGAEWQRHPQMRRVQLGEEERVSHCGGWMCGGQCQGSCLLCAQRMMQCDRWTYGHGDPGSCLL